MMVGSVTSDRVTDVLARSGPRQAHLRPIYEAVRDFGCAHLVVLQNAGAFEDPHPGRPLIATIGDDLDAALGPAAFHRASLKRLIRSCGAAVIVSSMAHLKPYAAAATQAVLLRHNVVIVETRLEQEDAWAALIRKYAPTIPMLISTVQGGTA